MMYCKILNQFSSVKYAFKLTAFLQFVAPQFCIKITFLEAEGAPESGDQGYSLISPVTPVLNLRRD